jgi:hypothetical protein
MIDEILKTIILQLPNFAGLILAIWVLREENARTLAALEKCSNALVKSALAVERLKE